MTKKKTLKERVRERQQKTGERYTTALAQVRKPLLTGKAREPMDLTGLARERGLTCTASASGRISRTGAATALDALKALLLALDGDSGATKMAEVLLRGKPGAPVSANGIAEAVEARRFITLVEQGRRGVSTNGRLAAFEAGGHTVIATVLWHSTRPAFLYLAPLGEGATSPWTASFALAGVGGWSRT